MFKIEYKPLLFKKTHLLKNMDSNSLVCFTVIGNRQAIIYITK